MHCETPAASGPPGFHTTAREPKRAPLRVPAFNHHQNSMRRPPERQEKNEFSGGRGKKKERKFGRSWGKGGPGEGRSWVSLGGGVSGVSLRGGVSPGGGGLRGFQPRLTPPSLPFKPLAPLLPLTPPLPFHFHKKKRKKKFKGGF